MLFISDEVITGFGRTGEWFALKHWNVKPDILSFAKAITSGYAQLGGIQISDEIRETIESAAESEAYMHGFTYSGHAMACAVGLKNLELMEKDPELDFLWLCIEKAEGKSVTEDALHKVLGDWPSLESVPDWILETTACSLSHGRAPGKAFELFKRSGELTLLPARGLPGGQPFSFVRAPD